MERPTTTAAAADCLTTATVVTHASKRSGGRPRNGQWTDGRRDRSSGRDRYTRVSDDDTGEGGGEVWTVRRLGGERESSS